MGLKVIDNGLCVHNSLHTLSQIFESAGKPQWSSGWNEILSRLTPEARPFGNNQRFSSGVAGRSLWIPLSAILVGEDDQDGKLVQSMLDADLTAKEGIPF